jgi:hypothetical protein
MEFLKLFGAIFITFSLAFVLINIRYWISGKEFRGTCAGSFKMVNGEGKVCSVCGRKPEETCGAELQK